jgi:hypothetical protein
MDLPGLNFKPGLGVQAAIHHRFNEPVNFFPRRGFSEFFLIASVGRCKFKLCENSTGLILQATLGGSAADFRPQIGLSSLWWLQETWVFISII